MCSDEGVPTLRTRSIVMRLAAALLVCLSALPAHAQESTTFIVATSEEALTGRTAEVRAAALSLGLVPTTGAACEVSEGASCIAQLAGGRRLLVARLVWGPAACAEGPGGEGWGASRAPLLVLELYRSDGSLLVRSPGAPLNGADVGAQMRAIVAH